MTLWDLECEASGSKLSPIAGEGDQAANERVKTEAEMGMSGFMMQEIQHEALSFLSRWEKKGATEFWIHITRFESSKDEEE